VLILYKFDEKYTFLGQFQYDFYAVGSGMLFWTRWPN